MRIGSFRSGIIKRGEKEKEKSLVLRLVNHLIALEFCGLLSLLDRHTRLCKTWTATWASENIHFSWAPRNRTWRGFLSVWPLSSKSPRRLLHAVDSAASGRLEHSKGRTLLLNEAAVFSER